MNGRSFPQRKRMRLRGFDYRTQGAYFITICTEHRTHLFGSVEDGQMALNSAGHMVRQVWLALPDKFPDAQLDAFIVMPNHVHFLIWIAWTPTMPSASPENSLIDTLQWFKSMTTTQYRHGVTGAGWPAYPGRLWQRSYYDHIVRDPHALNVIRQYILTNPERWSMDAYNADRRANDPLQRDIWQMLQTPVSGNR